MDFLGTIDRQWLCFRAPNELLKARRLIYFWLPSGQDFTSQTSDMSWQLMTCLSHVYHVCSDMFRQFSHETWRHLQHFAQHIAAYWRSCTECWGDLCLCRVWLSAMHLEFKSFGSKSCSCNYSTLSMLQQYVVRSCPYSGNDRNCWKWLWTFQL